MNRVLAISTEMLEAALDADWERLAALQRAREALLCSVLQQHMHSLEPNKSADGLREILALNDRAKVLAEDARNREGEHIRCLRFGRRAISKYRQSLP